MAATHFVAVVADLGGDILEIREGRTEPLESGGWLEFIAEILSASTVRLARNRCLGLGLVTPGPFDTTWPGVPTPGAIPALQRRNVIDELSSLTGVEVLLENDAMAAALGERLYGEARGVDNFFYVFIGEGVGGGIVIGGEPYRGSRGNAGEFGHIIIDPNGPKCYCGNNGCLGEYLSLGSLRQWQSRSRTSPQSSRSEWVRKAAEALSLGLADLENLFDPETIIIGGAAPPDLLRELVAQLGDLRASVRQDFSGERLRLSMLGERSAALGASALPILAATSF
jgi:predicted NBD/HSP70 family sugar kinase